MQSRVVEGRGCPEKRQWTCHPGEKRASEKQMQITLLVGVRVTEFLVATAFPASGDTFSCLRKGYVIPPRSWEQCITDNLPPLCTRQMFWKTQKLTQGQGHGSGGASYFSCTVMGEMSLAFPLGNTRRYSRLFLASAFLGFT